MYTLSQIRNQVNALQRKYALELSVARLHPLAEEFSLQWVKAVADRREAPQTHPFILRIARHGFRFDTYMDLHRYLEGCRRSGDLPDCYGIIGALYPQLTAESLLRLLEGNHPVPEPSPCLEEPQLRAMTELLNPRWLRRLDPSHWPSHQIVGWLFLYPFKRWLKNASVRDQATSAPSGLCRSPVQSIKA